MKRRGNVSLRMPMSSSQSWMGCNSTMGYKELLMSKSGSN